FSYCLWSRRPLTSTIFPYTTLLRSFLKFKREHIEESGVGQVAHLFIEQVFFIANEVLLHFRNGNKAGGRFYFWKFLGQRHGHWGDRKSTRLNSSHVKISYAVFCLKK